MTRSRIRILTVVLTLAIVSVIFAGCGLNRTTAQLSQQPDSQASAADKTKQAVLDRGAKVLQLLKANDMKALADMVHPDLGLRFSPYGYTRIGADGDRVFKASEISGLFEDKTVYNWGAYDGSGSPIDLTFAKYFARFVWDHDYTTAPNVAYNEILAKGNTIVNVREAYPNGVFVEYHFDGFDPKYGGADWSSLRLVFENKDGAWYLVGIIHNQWTI